MDVYSFIESDEVREYMRETHIFTPEQMLNIIMFGNNLIPLEKKLAAITELLSCFPLSNNDEKHQYDLTQSDVQKSLQISRYALDVEINSDEGSFFIANLYDRVDFTRPCFVEPFHSFEVAKNSMMEWIRNYSTGYCAKDFLGEIEKWKTQSDGTIQSQITYAISNHGDIVKYYVEKKNPTFISYLGIAADDLDKITFPYMTISMRLRLPFSPGDFIELDNRPYQDKIHGVFFDYSGNSEEPHECYHWLVYINQGCLEIEGLSDGFPGIPWSKVHSFSEKLPDDEKILLEISEVLKTEKHVGNLMEKLSILEAGRNNLPFYAKEYFTLQQLLNQVEDRKKNKSINGQV